MQQFAVATHPGYKRKHNEDRALADPQLGLWLVADGVGGHSLGEVASSIVADTMQQQVSAGRDLTTAIFHSHKAVLDEIHNHNIINNMGSTVVALSLAGREYAIAWVGDSRAYLWDGKLRQLTRDHNAVSELLARGAITDEEAANHPDRHVLTQSLGVSANMQLAPGSKSGSLRDQQQLLLCSDGLSDELSAATISHLMAANHTPAAQADALLQAALAAGGRDNITVVVVGGPGQNAQPHASPAAPFAESGEPAGSQVANNNSPRGIDKRWCLAAIALLLVIGALLLAWPW